MNAEFASIFSRLRDVLQKHAGALSVTADAPEHYCLSVDYSAKLKKGYPTAWVKTGKGCRLKICATLIASQECQVHSWLNRLAPVQADMKKLFALFTLGCAGAIGFSAEGPKPADAKPTSAAASTNTPPRRFGRDTANSNDVFYTLGPDSKARDGVPKGKYTEAKTLPSNVFPGTQHTYWVYVPAQYDPAQPTAVMIFNDGQAMKAEPGDVQAHHVLDNLIFRREIPVMLGVFINPGRRPDQPEPTPRDWGDRNTNRPDEYNHPNDKYARVIVEELMPALKKEFNISPDPELHGIMGASSGGIAAFTTAWFRPNEFRKVVTFVGSFTDIRGGYVLPEMVMESEKKPIRIFMQDGRNDNRRPNNLKWDWFHQNVRLAEALTKKGYDLNYTWGIGNHGQKQGGAIFPEMMRWLWRDQPVSSDPNDMVERSFRHPPKPAAEATQK